MTNIVEVLSALSIAFGKIVCREGEKNELNEDELTALGCRLVHFDFSYINEVPDEIFQKNAIILMEAKSGELERMRGATETIEGDDNYEEDGTAGAYETSGNCARASFDPNFAEDVSPFVVVDGTTHFFLDALDVYSGGYATCSCYQPYEVATFDDYEDTREVINVFLRSLSYDPVKSFMSGTGVAEEEDPSCSPDPYRVATDTAIENSVLDFASGITGYVLVVPPEMIPSEEKDDTSHLTDRLAEFDAFGDEESTKTDNPDPEDKD